MEATYQKKKKVEQCKLLLNFILFFGQVIKVILFITKKKQRMKVQDVNNNKELMDSRDQSKRKKETLGQKSNSRNPNTLANRKEFSGLNLLIKPAISQQPQMESQVCFVPICQKQFLVHLYSVWRQPVKVQSCKELDQCSVHFQQAG